MTRGSASKAPTHTHPMGRWTVRIHGRWVDM
jgi:hypothetical protein